MSEERIISTPAEFLELQRECIAKVRYYIDLANRKLDLRMDMPKVLFALNGMTAGTANFGTYTIKFNPTLMRENPDHFIVQTAGHEVGHLVARYKFRGRDIAPHGDEWKSVMWAMSLPATRCHNYDVSNVPTQNGTRSNKPRVNNGFGHGSITEFD